MLVSRISPAPARLPRAPTRPRRGPVGDAAAVDVDLEAVRRRRRACASIASTTHWAPKVSASSPISSGPRDRRRVDRRPCRRPRRAPPARPRRERMPPPIVNGMKTLSAVRRASSTIVSRCLVRGRDVEEHELVGALGVVALGQLDRVARVAQADEVGALHDAPLVDVEARDHALEARSRSASRRARLGLRDGEPAARRAPCPRSRRSRFAGRARASARRSSSVPMPPE